VAALSAARGCRPNREAGELLEGGIDVHVDVVDGLPVIVGQHPAVRHALHRVGEQKSGRAQGPQTSEGSRGLGDLRSRRRPGITFIDRSWTRRAAARDESGPSRQ
jgi:hypothetical protein